MSHQMPAVPSTLMAMVCGLDSAKPDHTARFTSHLGSRFSVLVAKMAKLRGEFDKMWPARM